MAKTRVVHVMREKYDVYIGRPGPFGNPYSHKPGTRAEFTVSTVEEAVSKYREYILQKPELLEALPELQGKTLGCWCKIPENPNAPCHGDVLVELVKERCGGDSEE